MGLYSEYVAPHLINWACGLEQISHERARIVSQASGTVLEVGFGGGRNLPFYDVSRVSKLYAANPPDGFLKLSEKAKETSPVPIEFAASPAEALPFENETVDTAVLTFTLCSVGDAMRSLEELRRVLKPSGSLLVIEHGRSSDPRMAKWQDRINPFWRPIGAGCNINRPIKQLVTFAGFETDNLEQHYMGGRPSPAGFLTTGLAKKR